MGLNPLNGLTWFKKTKPTIGQRLYSLTREALHNLLELTQSLLLQGKSTEQILEVMMPS